MHPPYGYMYDKEDTKKWIIDPEAAETIKLIYSLRLQGESINKIAEKLKREKVLIPVYYSVKRGLKKTVGKTPHGEFMWHHRTVQGILTHPAYIGDIVNFKTLILSLLNSKKD